MGLGHKDHDPSSQTTVRTRKAYSSSLSGLTYTLGSTAHCPPARISLHHVLKVFFKTQNLQHVPVHPVGAASGFPQHLEEHGKERRGEQSS